MGPSPRGRGSLGSARPCPAGGAQKRVPIRRPRRLIRGAHFRAPVQPGEARDGALNEGGIFLARGALDAGVAVDFGDRSGAERGELRGRSPANPSPTRGRSEKESEVAQQHGKELDPGTRRKQCVGMRVSYASVGEDLGSRRRCLHSGTLPKLGEHARAVAGKSASPNQGNGNRDTRGCKLS